MHAVARQLGLQPLATADDSAASVESRGLQQTGPDPCCSGFEQWGEILGDAMVAAALIDRLVHHATMITLKGKSYRLRERGLGVAPAAQAPSLPSSA